MPQFADLVGRNPLPSQLVLISLFYLDSVLFSIVEKALSSCFFVLFWISGEYEYVDVMVEGERLLIDIDFKSEFETARSTKNYRAILQSLPSIFVGKPDRLQQIVSVVCEAAEQSLKKKGLHFPPWRKPEYMRAKWLSPYQRLKPVEESQRQNSPCAIKTRHFSGEFELIFGEKNSAEPVSAPEQNPGEEKITVVVSPWQLPAIKPRASGEKIVTGLASLFRDKP